MTAAGPLSPGDPHTRSVAVLRDLLDTAIARAQPALCLPGYLPQKPAGRTVVVGAGKAVSAMAQAFERAWDGPLTGLVVTRHGHALDCERIAVREGGHPVPDACGLAATLEMIGMLDGLTDCDLVVCLLTGGGSALLAAPPPGVSLQDLQALNTALLESGAPIEDMNRVRRQCSLVANGRLTALAAPAQVVTLAISDVPGDDPAVIASGPTLPDGSTRLDAVNVLQKFGIAAPASIASWLECAPGEGDRAGTGGRFQIIASPSDAMTAAAVRAELLGFEAIIVDAETQDDAQVLARRHARLVRDLRARPHHGRPRIILSGGEASVVVTGRGEGGRNGTYSLALALEMADDGGCFALAADTDGIDGAGTAAGAIIHPTLLADADTRRAAAAALSGCDSHTFFRAAGALVETGPTHTNVNDFRAVIVDPAPPAGN